MSFEQATKEFHVYFLTESSQKPSWVLGVIKATCLLQEGGDSLSLTDNSQSAWIPGLLTPSSALFSP